jgi:hypothetical protein
LGAGVINKAHDTHYMFERYDQKLIVFAFMKMALTFAYEVRLKKILYEKVFFGRFHKLLATVLGFQTDLQGP